MILHYQKLLFAYRRSISKPSRVPIHVTSTLWPKFAIRDLLFDAACNFSRYYRLELFWPERGERINAFWLENSDGRG